MSKKKSHHIIVNVNELSFPIMMQKILEWLKAKI